MQSKRNESTIMKAFTGFQNNERQFMIAGMRGLLEDAVMYIYEQHRVDGHENHLEYGDTYGWALYDRGQLIDMRINIGPEVSEFSVTDELREKIQNYDGFVGVIMAGMDPSAFFWQKWEKPYMENAMDMIQAEYTRFFKK